MKHFLSILAVILLAAGCTSPSQRAKDSPEIFGKIPPAQKEAALRGEVSPGMNKNAVLIALGKPTRKTTINNDGHAQEKWIYTETRTEYMPNVDHIAFRSPNGANVVTTVSRPIPIPVPHDAIEIIFEKDQVVSCTRLR
ncbi:MAG: hypothetical protein PHV34_00065 [Verrucomicrobiae bacterium]|nr:hypothetical protein [Verrucomicrobiae bacterium]